MVSSDLNILGAFLIAAEERSFTKAAKRLGVSPSAVSHAIRGLEESVGVRLLSRTTRNVAPTEAGQELLVRLRPALTDIEDALDKLSGLRDKPVGRVRLVTPRLAALMVIAPRMKAWRRTTRILCSTSRRMRVRWILSREDMTPAFTSANTSRRT